jgi:hypothetical protein
VKFLRTTITVSWDYETLCVTPVIHKRSLCNIFLVLCYTRIPSVDCINRFHPSSSGSRVAKTYHGIDNQNDNRIANPFIPSCTAEHALFRQKTLLADRYYSWFGVSVFCDGIGKVSVIISSAQQGKWVTLPHLSFVRRHRE